MTDAEDAIEEAEKAADETSLTTIRRHVLNNAKATDKVMFWLKVSIGMSTLVVATAMIIGVLVVSDLRDNDRQQATEQERIAAEQERTCRLIRLSFDLYTDALIEVSSATDERAQVFRDAYQPLLETCGLGG